MRYTAILRRFAGPSEVAAACECLTCGSEGVDFIGSSSPAGWYV
jgi:hypothetical protein